MCRSGLVLVFVWKQSLRRQTKIRERQWTIFIWICAATCRVQCLFLVWLFRLLSSNFAPSYRTNDFRGPGFRLGEKRWRFFKPREISSHRKFGPVDRRVSNVMAFDFRRQMGVCWRGLQQRLHIAVFCFAQPLSLVFREIGSDYSCSMLASASCSAALAEALPSVAI